MANPTSSRANDPPREDTSKKRKHTADETTAEAELEVDVNAPEPPSKKDLRKLKKLKSKGVDTDALESLNVQLNSPSSRTVKGWVATSGGSGQEWLYHPFPPGATEHRSSARRWKPLWPRAD